MMRRIILVFVLAIGTVSIGQAPVSAFSPLTEDQSGDPATKASLSETDYYLDLNTGKVFQIMYDGLNEIYNRADLFAFDLYVNTRTRDTFWLEDAIVVNNALVRDASGRFRVDPMKVKRDGNGYRVINNRADKKAVPVNNAEQPAEAAGSVM